MANNWLELDREAVRHNARQLRALAAPARLMPVVKANYYGAGAAPIAGELAAQGVDAFAVATVREAVELRDAGIRGTIVVLTYFGRDEVEAIVERDIEPVVFTAETAAWISARARRRARVWVKVDTGLGRIGVPAREAAEFARRIAKRPGLEIAGLLSTLAENPERNPIQVARITTLRDELGDLGPLPISIASSQGILATPGSYADIVRPGIVLLGVVPHPERLDPALVARAAVRPVVTWKARVALVKRVPRGEQVGYGVRAPLDRETPVATLAVGWADGYAQTLAGVGQVLVRGRRCPILAMSANSTMVDLSTVGEVPIDEEAVLLGRQGDAEIRTAEIAQVIGSYYRVLAGIPATAERRWTATTS
ncbi:MAG: alanine racemase [Candidatus Rokubacteria bacterium]|nr:alanine racemase [Candidatus Rokubacteria bacterium]